jgi:tetratricopeptide (TPR) repeat protein
MRRPIDPDNDVLAVVRESLRTGNFSAALDALVTALVEEPNNPAYHDLIAGVYYFQGDYEAALPHAQRAVELAHDSAEYLRGEGTILAALDRSEEAIERLSRVVMLVPGDVDARNNLGAALLKTGQLADAERELREALKHRPGDINALFNLGIALFRQGRHTLAEETLRTVLDHPPDDAAKLIELGRTFHELGYLRGAEAALNKALEKNPAAVEALSVLARIEERRGNFERAEEMIREALSQAPNDNKILENQGFIYLNWNRLDDALQAFSDAHKSNPQSVDALAGISHFPPAQVDFDLRGSIDLVRQGLDPGDNDKRFILDFAEARALDKAGDYSGAWRVALQANAGFCDSNNLAKQQGTDFVTGVAAESADQPGPLDDGAGSGAGNPDLPPLLIVAGMPRSGKTTLEALISGVPGVRRGFENNIFSESVEALNEQIGFKLARSLNDLPESYLPQFRQIFHGKLAERVGTCAAYTMTIAGPYVMNNIGNILRLTPGARFVFLNRDIWDNALRIFLVNYRAREHGYAYRLGDIFKQVEAWRLAMDWWSKAAPKRCLTLSYEDMIADPGEALVRVCALMGLPIPEQHLVALPDDRGCAAPYRDMMDACFNDENPQT